MEKKTIHTMIYDFDKVIDRRGTSAIKLEWLQQMWGRTDLMPLWVADMDFATAPFVTEAIKERLDKALDEIKRAPEYDYIVVNDDLLTAVEDIFSIISSNRLILENQKHIINEVLKGE